MTVRVGINGFGRIGRLVFRRAMERGAKDVEICHINDLTDAKTLAHLLKYDSVHGTWDKEVTSDNENLIVGGKKFSVSAIKSPSEIPWKSKNVDIVLECTGKFTKKKDAEEHLKAGVAKVLISAPATDEDITVVMGVNSHKLEKSHKIVSCASCTTNCLAPVAKVIHEKFGVKRGLMTTIHSYTNDQNTLDFPHKDLRRARAAALSMIPTTTGAAKAVGLVLPELKGKLNGLAIRVPTPNVSLVDVVFEVSKTTTVEEVNQALREAANGALKGILAVSDLPLVSCDFNGNLNSSIVDSANTFVMDGTMIKVMSWYDNEYAFSDRMVDLMIAMMK